MAGASKRTANERPLSYFEKNTGRLIHKWHHYFEIYDRHFARYRGRSPRVLEIGVSQGGSLQMWRDYFGPGTRLFGVDINPACEWHRYDSILVLEKRPIGAPRHSKTGSATVPDWTPALRARGWRRWLG
jgi:hypothetical protein